MRRGDRKLWPLSVTGTLVAVPVLGLAIVAGDYAFWWTVNLVGAFAVRWAQ